MLGPAEQPEAEGRVPALGRLLRPRLLPFHFRGLLGTGALFVLLLLFSLFIFRFCLLFLRFLWVCFRGLLLFHWHFFLRHFFIWHFLLWLLLAWLLLFFRFLFRLLLHLNFLSLLRPAPPLLRLF